MIKKIVIYLSVTIGIIALFFGGIWSYYSIRWPYQWQHAEQTSLSTHFWDPLLILMKSEPSEIKEQMTAIDTEAYHRNWDKAQKFMQGKGIWLAALNFLPSIGNAIIICMGVARTPFWKVFFVLGFGIFVRFLVWMLMTMGVVEYFF